MLRHARGVERPKAGRPSPDGERVARRQRSIVAQPPGAECPLRPAPMPFAGGLPSAALRLGRRLRVRCDRSLFVPVVVAAAVGGMPQR